jgi:hypothetical protein
LFFSFFVTAFTVITIFVSPLFDIELILAFADNSFSFKSHKKKNELIKNMEKSLRQLPIE